MTSLEMSEKNEPVSDDEAQTQIEESMDGGDVSDASEGQESNSEGHESNGEDSEDHDGDAAGLEESLEDQGYKIVSQTVTKTTVTEDNPSDSEDQEDERSEGSLSQSDDDGNNERDQNRADELQVKQDLNASALSVDLNDTQGSMEESLNVTQDSLQATSPSNLNVSQVSDDMDGIRQGLDQVTRNILRDQESDLKKDEKIQRKKILKKYKQTRELNAQLHATWQTLQDRLCNYFKSFEKKNMFEANEKPLSSNSEEIYKKYVLTHQESRVKLQELKKKHKESILNSLEKLQAKQKNAVTLQTTYREYKTGIARQAENSRTGKPIPESRIQDLGMLQSRKDEDVREIRTAYLYLHNKKQYLDRLIKEKEYSDGLHLIDFEQLKMENATLNERVEERNESLQKSQLKARTTIHILTHVNEKLQFVQSRDIKMKNQLADLDQELSENKKILAKLKDVRDFFKNHNSRLRDTNPLIGNDQLLMDYENRKQELEDLRYRVKELKNEHKENDRKTIRIKRQLHHLINQDEQGGFLPNIR